MGRVLLPDIHSSICGFFASCKHPLDEIGFRVIIPLPSLGTQLFVEPKCGADAAKRAL